MKDTRCGPVLAAAVACTFLFADLVSAQAPATPPVQATADIQQLRSELERLRNEYGARLAQIEARIQALEGGAAAATQPGVSPEAIAAQAAADTAGASRQEPAAQPAVAMPGPEAASAAAQTLPGSAQVFNPDTSVIGNFVGAAGDNRAGAEPALQFTEAELSLQAVVDPYARADFFLAASPEGLEVEEGFVTFTTLPGNLLLKVGKMRAQFGKVNTLHTHAMPTADRPLATVNLVGGEEGLSDSGLSVSHLVHNPFLFLELTGEAYRGESAVFQSAERSDLAYVGRVRAYRDLTEATNLDFGFSVAHGKANVQPNVLDAADPLTGDRTFYGFDATFRYRPLRRAIYKRLNLRTELIWNRQETFVDHDEHAFGFYGLGEYQFARRWYIGGRIDRSERALDASLVDKGGSVFLTFWPSEFSQIRGQYRRTDYAGGIDANEFLFQFNFSIGAHGAHVF